MWNFLSHLVISLGTFVGLISVPPTVIPPTIDTVPTTQIATSTTKVPSISTPTEAKKTQTPVYKPQPALQMKSEPIIPAPTTTSAPTVVSEPPRTYTNELGQIVTENGTVLWSPPKPAVAPTPTTTPVVDEIACGYEVEAGLPLGSKCPPAFSPDGKPLFPCYPNQPWTCRNNPTPPAKCTITNREGFTYQATCQ
jgi:hypothetical protein